MTYDEKRLIDYYRCASHEMREVVIEMLDRSAQREKEKAKSTRGKWSVIQGGSSLKAQNEPVES